jgi:hypothetical protein
MALYFQKMATLKILVSREFAFIHLWIYKYLEGAQAQHQSKAAHILDIDTN